jgi:hypothetical protein
MPSLTATAAITNAANGSAHDQPNRLFRPARAGGASVDPVVPAGFEWRQALGDY